MSGGDELSIWDHLDELAKRLRWMLFSVAVATILVASIPSDPAPILRLDFSDYRPMISNVIESIEDHLLPEGVNLMALNWLDTFTVFILVALVFGVILSLPVISYEVHKFINPALYPHERKTVLVFMAVFIVLFSIGAIYSYWILLPITFNVLMRFVYQTGVTPLFSVLDFFNIVAVGMVGSGLFYTLPLVIFLLVKIGIMEVQTLRENRRKVFLGLLIITAILTPDPTPFSMLFMVIPFYLLYELTIQIVSRIRRDEWQGEIVERGVEASRRLLERSEKAR